MTNIIELETARLRIRQWRDEDRDPFADLNADPRVMEFFPGPLDHSESNSLMERCRSLVAEQGWGFWAVETRERREFIGFVGLNVPAYQLPFSPCVEIGWRLGARHWGKGYATEAAKEALRVGFEQLGFQEIVSFTAVDNQRSRAVMERLKMKDTQETFEHPKIAVGNPLRLHCLYRLSSTQWLENEN